jgi:hypothetical protein
MPEAAPVITATPPSSFQAKRDPFAIPRRWKTAECYIGLRGVAMRKQSLAGEASEGPVLQQKHLHKKIAAKVPGL